MNYKKSLRLLYYLEYLINIIIFNLLLQQSVGEFSRKTECGQVLSRIFFYWFGFYWREKYFI